MTSSAVGLMSFKIKTKQNSALYVIQKCLVIFWQSPRNFEEKEVNSKYSKQSGQLYSGWSKCKESQQRLSASGYQPWTTIQCINHWPLVEEELKPVLLCETSPFILMQLQITTRNVKKVDYGNKEKYRLKMGVSVLLRLFISSIETCNTAYVL